MTSIHDELDIVFNRVDDWFTSLPLEDPIKQFGLDDHARLSLITRTTLNWFKFLTNPPLTDEGLEEEFFEVDDTSPICNKKQKCISRTVTRSQNLKKGQNSRKTSSQTQANKSRSRTSRSNVSLDSLARDLELLLEEGETTTDKKCDDSSQISFHPIYLDDELALLDTTIGMSCEIDQRSHDTEAPENSSSSRKVISVVMASNELSCRKSSDEDQADLKIVTPTPSDHDYLHKPRRNIKPLIARKMLVQTARRDNILNRDAIKRFARFSDKFRVLSMIDC